MLLNRFWICACFSLPLFLFSSLSAGNATAATGDWPNWRGPDHNGISKETNWKPWQGKPKVAWKKNVGTGYSSVAVKGGRVFTIGYAGNKDTVVCLDADSGNQVWAKSYDCAAGSKGYPGPRSTPGVVDGLVHVLSNQAQALALDEKTGDVKWQKNLGKELGLKKPQWDFCSSAYVEGDLVFYNIGSSGVALNKNSGQVMWKSQGGMAGYASPVAYTYRNRRCLAMFAASGLVSVDLKTGTVLWQQGWDTSYKVNAADPIILGERVFISSNYGRGGAVFDFASGRPTKVWENKSMKNHFNSSVLINGQLYGNDEGTLKCMDFQTGQVRWSGKKKEMERGGVMAAGDKLIALTGKGTLIIADAAPTAYTERARANVLRGVCWSVPVLSNGRIYCRAHKGELVCLDVR